MKRDKKRTHPFKPHATNGRRLPAAKEVDHGYAEMGGEKYQSGFLGKGLSVRSVRERVQGGTKFGRDYGVRPSTRGSIAGTVGNGNIIDEGGTGSVIKDE